MNIILIARYNILEGLLSAKYLLMSLVIMIAFVFNGFYYSEKIQEDTAAWEQLIRIDHDRLEASSEKLIEFARTEQKMAAFPPAYSFIADYGEVPLPTATDVNPVKVGALERYGQINSFATLVPQMDWSFIIGTFMSLLVILVSFDAVSGEKRNGTLSLILANQVSRLELFVGKYLGLLATVLITLAAGMLASLCILLLNNAVSLSAGFLAVIFIVFLVSILGLSFVLLLSMAVSSLTARNAISLMSTLIIWTVLVAAIPGLARILAENSIDVPSSFEFRKNQRAVWADMWNSKPDIESHEARARLITRMNEAEQKLYDDYSALKIKQASRAQYLAQISPLNMMGYSFQQVVGSDVQNLNRLLSSAHTYKNQLYDFIIERDRQDPDSGHIFYHWRSMPLWETPPFSEKPVENLVAMPRWQDLVQNQPVRYPFVQILILFGLNLQMAAIAFAVLYRYDPR